MKGFSSGSLLLTSCVITFNLEYYLCCNAYTRGMYQAGFIL